jgi:hypothetical protein
MSNEKITVRDACRRRMPLDGTDAQALEHALTITERERDTQRLRGDDLVLRAEKAEAELARLREGIERLMATQSIPGCLRLSLSDLAALLEVPHE